MIKLAAAMGASHALMEQLFVAYFTEGIDIGEIDNLVEIAKRSGMEPDHTREWLKSGQGLREVMAETRFAYENGINSVPCFIFNRQYAISGAQEPEAFFPLFAINSSSTGAMVHQAWQEPSRLRTNT